MTDEPTKRGKIRDALAEMMAIAADIRARQPKVYVVESRADPYGFFHNDCIWDYPAKAERYPSWKEPQA